MVNEKNKGDLSNDDKMIPTLLLSFLGVICLSNVKTGSPIVDRYWELLVIEDILGRLLDKRNCYTDMGFYKSGT